MLKMSVVVFFLIYRDLLRHDDLTVFNLSVFSCFCVCVFFFVFFSLFRIRLKSDGISYGNCFLERTYKVLLIIYTVVPLMSNPCSIQNNLVLLKGWPLVRDKFKMSIHGVSSGIVAL